LLLIFQLPETQQARSAIKLKNVLKDYGALLTHSKFLLYASMPNMLVTAYLTFVGSAAFYYINSCNLSYFAYAAHQGTVVISFSLMSFYAHKVIAYMGSEKAVTFGIYCSTISTVLMTFFAFVLPFNPFLITFT